MSVFVQGCVAGGQNGRGGGSSLKFVPTPIHDVFHVYLLPFLDVSRLCIPKYTKVIVYCTWMSTKENSMISFGHGQMLFFLLHKTKLQLCIFDLGDVCHPGALVFWKMCWFCI